ncbi:hypothetical protein LBMAG33_5250 [Candidatus Levyibacteriota bacterium]|nr:hypothetical protein LBMAG33_5250 [Candidatus Levybacteria bacterium]
MKILIQPILFLILLIVRIGDIVLDSVILLFSIIWTILFIFYIFLSLFIEKLSINHHRKKINLLNLNKPYHQIAFINKKTKNTHHVKKSKIKLFSFFNFLQKNSTKENKNKTKLSINKHFSIFIKFKYFMIGAVFSLLFIFTPLIIIVFLQDLPSPRGIWIGQIPQTTKIYDRNGIFLYQIYSSQNRTIVPIEFIPKKLQEATIAIEDKDFYKHPGFDITAIIRSLIKNASSKELQGGSTITQQLIKSALLSPEKSFQRKIKETVIAFWTERIYSKKQILEMYFNQIPYGGTAWGIEAASETYFGKKISDITLGESAFLAGIPRAPSIYSPYGLYPNLWKKRQKDVLRRMNELGYISKSEAEDAGNENIQFKSQDIPMQAPHFITFVRNFLINKYGVPLVEKGGLKVITTIDLKLQDMAQEIVTEEINANATLNMSNGSALITNPENGDILAMIGSKDFYDPESGNVNLTTSLRQPGSTVKVITYSAAMQNGYTAATAIDDSPFIQKTAWGTIYSPVNYDGKSHGYMPLRFALGNSFNIAAVRTISNIGVPTMINLARKMGIKSWDNSANYWLPVTLGANEATMLDMSTVFGTLANKGISINLNPLLKVTDHNDNVIEEKKEVSGIKVLSEGIAYIISNIISDNNARALEFGTNSPLHIPGQYVSVKTGTSDNKRDNWTIGYTKNRLVSVWVGNNDNSPMSQKLTSGISGAAPIWNKIMTKLLTGKKITQGKIPKDVIEKKCQGRIELFIIGTENSVNCNPSFPLPSIITPQP